MRGSRFAFAISGLLLLLLTPNLLRADTPNQLFIERASQDLLNRAADPTMLSTYTPQLDSSVITRTQFAMIIESGDEYRGDEVQGAYQLLLHRPADSLGLSAGVTLLKSSGTMEQLRSNLAGSSEYFTNRGGGSNDGFLTALYSDLLSRSLSLPERTLDDAALGSETTGQFALNLMGLTEYHQDLVEAWYQQFLHRSADPTGLNLFTTQMGSGATDETVIAEIVGSDEYFQDAQAPEPATLSVAAAGILLLMRRPRQSN